MNTIATFENTVGILVKAYLEGSLLKGDCHACAVGNLCAAALHTKVLVHDRSSWSGIEWDNIDLSPAWGDMFRTIAGRQQVIKSAWDKENVREQIEATGYTWEQLAQIEYAFETAKEGFNEAADFAGVLAVVDVLAQIHGIDLTTATAAKALFVKAV